VRAGLDRRGVQTGIHYPVPCHQQEPYLRYRTAPLPVVERAAREMMSLPIYVGMPDDLADRAASAVLDVLAADG
jgi:dTDP-4-amino-4,6-dideoxygalactose transaminase